MDRSAARAFCASAGEQFNAVAIAADWLQTAAWCPIMSARQRLRLDELSASASSEAESTSGIKLSEL